VCLGLAADSAFSGTIGFVLIEFLLAACCGVTSITPFGKSSNQNLADEVKDDSVEANWRIRSVF
jgi:hypothetical protein